MLAKQQSSKSGKRESADSILAKNLVVARAITGMTQHKLASASGVSRATIAQLETGYSDPRLSTIADLATALGVPPIFLLIGLPEVQAISSLTNGQDSEPVTVSSPDLSRMNNLVESGMLKDRLRAARLGADLVKSIGATDIVPIIAAIFSAFLPGAGTASGATLGERLAEDWQSGRS